MYKFYKNNLKILHGLHGLYTNFYIVQREWGAEVYASYSRVNEECVRGACLVCFCFRFRFLFFLFLVAAAGSINRINLQSTLSVARAVFILRSFYIFEMVSLSLALSVSALK